MKTLQAAAIGLSLLLTGCTAVKVRPTDLHRHAEQRRSGVLDGGGLSASTRESLRILGLPEADCHDRPVPCLHRLRAGDGLDEERRLSALAELWLREAAISQPRRPTDTLDSYLEAARASYAYLFFTPRKPGERALEDRQGQVRDFFNYATERVATLLFEEARRQGRIVDLARESFLFTDAWTIHRGRSDVRLPAGRPIHELIPASRLSFEGIRNAYRRDGFGAELVAVAPENGEEAGASREMGFVAASVVLRFPGSSLEEVMTGHEAMLDVYDSARHESISLHGIDVRLAANFTAPYALWLERSRFSRQAKRILGPGGEDLLEPRVYLMQPYDPDLLTVVLIHGLASSPEAWVDLANELMGDDEIRRRCQIWQVFYRSSAPIPYNQRAIRQALNETLERFDPGREATASSHMVLVGHSMGGVITRLLVSDAGDQLWTTLLGRPPTDADRQRLAVLAPYLDLKPMPEVRRAVFMASPHRGAPKASGWLGRTASRLVRLPVSVVGKLKEISDALSTDQPEAAARLRRSPDGIDALSDRFPFREVTSELPIAPGIAYHSILASADGLVPYSSAHLEGAASELIVTSGHSVQKTPEAILELRRILHLHLQEKMAGRN